MSQSRKTFPHSAFSCILYFVFSCLYSVAKLQMMHSAIHTFTIKTSKVLSLLFWDMSHSHSSLNGGSQKSSTNPSPGVHWIYRKDIVRWADLWVGGCLLEGCRGNCVGRQPVPVCCPLGCFCLPPYPARGVTSLSSPLLKSPTHGAWAPGHCNTGGLHALLLRLF